MLRTPRTPRQRTCVRGDGGHTTSPYRSTRLYVVAKSSATKSWDDMGTQTDRVRRPAKCRMKPSSGRPFRDRAGRCDCVIPEKAA